MQQARPETTPRELESLCRSQVQAAGARPVTEHIGGFGHACSISTDKVVAHARPDCAPFRKGQLVTIDLMLTRDGWHADVADSVVVDGGGHALIDSLDGVWHAGLSTIKPGVIWADVVAAMADAARVHDVRLVQELAGHGIGLAPHELPAMPLVPTSVAPPLILRPGMVFTFEPAITTGSGEIVDSEDGWAICTGDGAPAVAREAMIAVESDGIRVLGWPGANDS